MSVRTPFLGMVRRGAIGRARRLRLCGALAALVTCTGAHAGDLSAAVSTALAMNPKVAAAGARRDAAASDLRSARGGYFPTVDVDGAVGRERSNIKQLRVNGADDRWLGPTQFGVTVRQMVFDGLGTRNEVERRAALLTAAGSDAANTRESVAFSAVQAYVDVLRGRQLVQLARQNLSAHEDILDKVRQRVEGGVSRTADLHQAEGRVALARSTVVVREGRLREAVARYIRVVGDPPGALTDLDVEPPTLVRDGKVDAETLAAAVKAATDEALADHPSLRAAEARVSAADAARRASKAAFMPRLDLEAAMNRDGDQGGVAGARNQDSVMLVGSWNLFRGGADRAREEAAGARRVAASADATTTRQAIEEAVSDAVQSKATSEERLAYLREHARASEQTLDAYKAQFELGRRSLLDVLNAGNELFQARSSLASGRYDDILNRYFVAASKGMLVESLGLAAKE